MQELSLPGPRRSPFTSFVLSTVSSPLIISLFLPLISRATPLPPSVVVPAENSKPYEDGRPVAHYRLPAIDQGIVLRHGDGPGQCDYLGARDVWVWESGGLYYMHYDGAGPKGWLTCLATSK